MTATFGASEYVLRRLEKHGVKRLFHTPFGADTSLFRPSDSSETVREEWGGTGKRLALYLSRINAEKGIVIRKICSWSSAAMGLVRRGYKPF